VAPEVTGLVLEPLLGGAFNPSLSLAGAVSGRGVGRAGKAAPGVEGAARRRRRAAAASPKGAPFSPRFPPLTPRPTCPPLLSPFPPSPPAQLTGTGTYRPSSSAENSVTVTGPETSTTYKQGSTSVTTTTSPGGGVTTSVAAPGRATTGAAEQRAAFLASSPAPAASG
jgi:hypothetical protein